MAAAASKRSTGHTRAAFVVRSTVDNLRRLGVDVDRVLARIGLDLDAYGLIGRVPMEMVRALWDEAERMSGNDMLGVEVAKLMDPSQLDVLGQCMRTSATLREAAERLRRYLSLLSDAWDFELVTQGDVASYRLLFEEEEHPQVIECQVATTGILARAMVGRELMPREVRFRHPEPPRAARAKVLFGANVVFDAAHNELVFDRDFLDLPVVGHDAVLCAVLDRLADQMLQELAPRGGFVHDVREALIAGLRYGTSSSREVAERLAMSERTLRRKLAEHDTSFRELVDHARHALAMRYLRGTELDVSEIGFQLGFANVSAFGRAFRRWAGCSPLEYRRSNSLNA